MTPEPRHLYSCASVPAGWQTCIDSKELIGPVFQKTTELWAWQRLHLNQFVANMEAEKRASRPETVE